MNDYLGGIKREKNEKPVFYGTENRGVGVNR